MVTKQDLADLKDLIVRVQALAAYSALDATAKQAVLTAIAINQLTSGSTSSPAGVV